METRIIVYHQRSTFLEYCPLTEVKDTFALSFWFITSAQIIILLWPYLNTIQSWPCLCHLFYQYCTFLSSPNNVGGWGGCRLLYCWMQISKMKHSTWAGPYLTPLKSVPNNVKLTDLIYHIFHLEWSLDTTYICLSGLKWFNTQFTIITSLWPDRLVIAISHCPLDMRTLLISDHLSETFVLQTSGNVELINTPWHNLHVCYVYKYNCREQVENGYTCRYYRHVTARRVISGFSWFAMYR